MKKNLIIIALFLGIVGCYQQPTIEKNGGIIVTASFPSYNDLVKKDLKIIKERFLGEDFVLQSIVFDSLKNTVVLTIPKAKDTLIIKELLTKKGNISIFNSYENSEIIQDLVKANENLKQIKKDSIKNSAKSVSNKKSTLIDLVKSDTTENFLKASEKNPLFSILIPSVSRNSRPTPGALLGYAKVSDTALVMNYLKLPINRRLFPMNLVFLWSLKSSHSDNKIYELYAIKNDKLGFEDVGKNVIKCRYEVGATNSSYEINFKLNADGTRIFAHLTRINMGRCLPMTLDNKVIIAPRVNGTIEKGEVVITGNFDLMEAKIISNIFKNGAISGSLTITHLKIINPK